MSKQIDEITVAIRARNLFDPERLSNTTCHLIDLLTMRDAHGRAKYGTTLDRTDLKLSDWLQHQTEELLDGAGYAQSARRLALLVEQLDFKLLERALVDAAHFANKYTNNYELCAKLEDQLRVVALINNKGG